MRAWFGLWLIYFLPMFAREVEAEIGADDADQRASAREALEEKLAEAERLQVEIKRLRELSGDLAPNVSLRIRLVEVSLTNVKGAGMELPDPSHHEAMQIEEQFAVLIDRSVAKLAMDKVLSVADGSEAQIRAGTELPPVPRAKGVAGLDKLEFAGTEIVVRPKLQSDGRLHVRFACNNSRPIIYGDAAPQRRTHEISTEFELGPDEAVVLEGVIDQRIASSTRDVFGLGVFRRVTDEVNEIQTFVIVSLLPRSQGTQTLDSNERQEGDGHQTAQSRRISVRRVK